MRPAGRWQQAAGSEPGRKVAAGSWRQAANEEPKEQRAADWEEQLAASADGKNKQAAQ